MLFIYIHLNSRFSEYRGGFNFLMIMLEFVLFAKYVKSYKDPGFHTSERDNLLDVIYKHVYASP